MKNIPTGLSRGTRTPDIKLPKLAFYQTELYLDIMGRKATKTLLELKDGLEPSTQ